MSQYLEPLLPDGYYHIYNHANGNDNLFRNEKNYYHFLEKYAIYIPPIADTFAYSLMPNHFHLFLRIKSLEELLTLERTSGILPTSEVVDNSGTLPTSEVFETTGISSNAEVLDASEVQGASPGFESSGVPNSSEAFHTCEVSKKLESFISQQFSNFFNSYTKSYNLQYDRMGSLFNHRFKRKEVLTNINFIRLVEYIHLNPVSHGFVKDVNDWKFSSYHSFIGNGPTEIKRDEALEWFGSLANFKYLHETDMSSKYILKFD